MYTALSASLEGTYENQLNKHICAQRPGNRVGDSWGEPGGFAESRNRAVEGLEDVTPRGSDNPDHLQGWDSLW